MQEDKLYKLVQEALDENPELFLIDIKTASGGKIEITVDGDHGVSIDEIVRISRHVENGLDREEQDFALNVMSAGVGNPLVTPRQYLKNTGRRLQVTKDPGNETLEGTLESADEEGILLKWKVREPKPVGKGKHTVEKEERILYKDIKKAIVKIIFKNK